MNLGQWITRRAQQAPGDPFVIVAEEVCDNQTFEACVRQVTGFLSHHGIRKGDRVAVLLGNRRAFLELFFACAGIGALFVPLNQALTGAELAYMVADCQPRLVVHEPASREMLESLLAQVQGEIRTVQFDEDWPPSGVDACSGEGSRSAPGASGEVVEDDPLAIIYTSGTTGDPKGAVLSHGNFLHGARHSIHSYNLDAEVRSLVVAPLYHIGALAASVTPVVYAGGALVLSDFDHPTRVLERIERHRINYMFAVPVMFQLMTRSERWATADFSEVRFFIAGGAPMPPALIRRYQEEKGVRFAQGYAMTETLRITTLDLADAGRKAGSVGKETCNTRLCVVDDEGQALAPGAVGEIVVRGPTVFKGYWNRPAETAASFREGWFHTGDLGYRDPEGFLYLRGRKTDMIITAGKNVYAAEVERALEQLPQVTRAAVMGLPDDQRGEAVVAFLVLARGAPLEEAQLRQELGRQIAAYKIPRRFIAVADLPVTLSGKIQKFKLRADLGASDKALDSAGPPLPGKGLDS